MSLILGTIRLRRKTSREWTAEDPILDQGEPGYETDTGRFKIGNGFERWTILDYYLPAPDVRAEISRVLAGSGTGGDMTLFQEAIQMHINSQTPHPVYDDGPSLVLLYQNKKV